MPTPEKVLVRAYAGQWISHGQAPGIPAVRVLGMTAFPFAITGKILGGEPYKSLASVARALRVVAARTQAGPPSAPPARLGMGGTVLR